MTDTPRYADPAELERAELTNTAHRLLQYAWKCEDARGRYMWHAHRHTVRHETSYAAAAVRLSLEYDANARDARYAAYGLVPSLGTPWHS